MAQAIIWTEAQDTRIKRLRAERASWDVIALAVGVSRWTAIERGRVIGARLPPDDFVPAIDMDRQPYPAGAPETWGAMIAGTCLAGMAYPLPVVL